MFGNPAAFSFYTKGSYQFKVVGERCEKAVNFICKDVLFSLNNIGIASG